MKENMKFYLKSMPLYAAIMDTRIIKLLCVSMICMKDEYYFGITINYFS